MSRHSKKTSKSVQITSNRARRTRSCMSTYVHYQPTVNNSLWLYKFVFGRQTRTLLCFLMLSVLIPPLPVAAMVDDEVVLVGQTVESFIVESSEAPIIDNEEDQVESAVSLIESADLQQSVNPIDLDSNESVFDIDSEIDPQGTQPDLRLATSSESGDIVLLDFATSTESTTTVPATRVDDDVGDIVRVSNHASEPESSSGTLSVSSIEEDMIDPTFTGPTQTLVSTVESDSLVTFSRTDCVSIENGTFYCQKPPETNQLPDGLFAAPDTDGDLEIFLVRDGVRTQITHNYVDDASPFYDPFSNTIVWHRLIDDRYQIISFDVATGKEMQLTNTRVNNMEPTRHGEYTVWQRWIDNNWEIMLHDGTKELRLTKSSEHDIAPRIRGSLVIWNTRAADGSQQLQTYDIAQRTLTRISDAAGIAVQNPRMVVMFDEVHQNGDIITRGYDLLSGEVIPLSAIPRELSDKIPVSDGTGETRALIPIAPMAPKSSDDSDDESEPLPLVTADDDLTLDLSIENPSVAEETYEVYEIPDLDLSHVQSVTDELDVDDSKSEIPDIVLTTYAEIASSTHP